MTHEDPDIPGLFAPAAAIGLLIGILCGRQETAEVEPVEVERIVRTEHKEYHQHPLSKFEYDCMVTEVIRTTTTIRGEANRVGSLTYTAKTVGWDLSKKSFQGEVIDGTRSLHAPINPTNEAILSLERAISEAIETDPSVATQYSVRPSFYGECLQELEETAQGVINQWIADGGPSAKTRHDNKTKTDYLFDAVTTAAKTSGFSAGETFLAQAIALFYFVKDSLQDQRYREACASTADSYLRCSGASFTEQQVKAAAETIRGNPVSGRYQEVGKLVQDLAVQVPNQIDRR